MFGDPSCNSKGLRTIRLKECLERIDSGKSLNCENFSRTGDMPAVLKLSAVTYGVYNALENKALPNVSMFIPELEVHSGDLLFSRKNTYEYVGMTAYVKTTPPNLMMPDLIFRLVPKEICKSKYLHILLNHDLFRPKVMGLAGGSTGSMPNISKQRLLELEIPLPSLEQQDEFIVFFDQTDKSKFAVHLTDSNLNLSGLIH